MDPWKFIQNTVHTYKWRQSLQLCKRYFVIQLFIITSIFLRCGNLQCYTNKLINEKTPSIVKSLE